MLNLSIFENPFPNIFILKKWDWDYLEAESMQLKCIDYVLDHPECAFLIICSHPHCFTLGRGLQKIKDSDVTLVDYDPETKLSLPLHSIKRGGGLTFHYPGQFVFYPIISLTYYKKAVFDLMLSIMEITKNILEKQFNYSGLVIRRDLLGIWFENKFARVKIGSIGLAVHRYNTYHGLALNFFNDNKMFNELQLVHPCGLSGDTYRNLETIFNDQLSLNDREEFTKSFTKDFVGTIFIKHLQVTNNENFKLNLSKQE
jgi:lipoyl(octanoyl) transferase